MSDIIRKLLKAEAPKTISKEQLFVYVPQDYHGAVADTAEAAAVSAKGAQLSLQYAIGKKYRAYETTVNLEFDDFDKFLAKVHFVEGYYNFYKYDDKWYLGDVTNGNIVTLEGYGIKPSSVTGNRATVAIDVADVAEGEEGHENNSEYYAGLAADSADDAAEYKKESEGYAVGTQNGVPVTEGSPYYQKNAKHYSEQAKGYKDTAESAKDTAVASASEAKDYRDWAVANAEKSEGYAVGKKNGVDVGTTSPYYHNNAKYYSENANEQARNAGDYSDSAYTFKEEALAAARNASQSAQNASDYLDEMDTKYASKQDKKPDGTNDLIQNGKVAMQYIPDGIVGQVAFQGTWNATTGTPKKPFPSETKEGFYWICSAPGSKLPNGENSSFLFETGDWAIIIEHDDEEGDTWDKVDNTDAVHSVNGYIGDVVAKASGVDIYGVEYDSIDGAVFSGDFHTLNADGEEDSVLATLNLPIIPGEGMTIDADEEREHLIVKPDLDVVQRKLPTVVKDRYLHTNATTGAFEWSEVEQGSSSDENAVHYTAETKTASEKAQARENIGAIGSTNAELGDAMPVVADNLKGVTGATVGQFAKIKTVDENGNPTEWESAEAGGSSVIANPTLAGTETALTGLEVDGVKYGVSGGGKLYSHLVSLTSSYAPSSVEFSLRIISKRSTPYASAVQIFTDLFGVQYDYEIPSSASSYRIPIAVSGQNNTADAYVNLHIRYYPSGHSVIIGSGSNHYIKADGTIATNDYAWRCYASSTNFSPAIASDKVVEL